MPTKTKRPPKTARVHRAELVIRHRDGPMPPEREAAMERFWKSFTMMVLNSDDPKEGVDA